MPTEYNIKKIQLPNGSICNLPDDVKYIDITKSGESYSLPTGVTYTTIKSIIDNGELCVLKVPFSGTDESGYKYFYPIKDYTYEVESTDYYDLKFVSSADPNETGIEILTITSLNSVSIDNFPLGVSQSEVNTIVDNKTVGVAYGESTTAAATAQKEVTVADISELNVGQIIIVKPTITSSVANSTLKVNDFPAYSMLYNGSAISTSTDSIVWAANVPSMFVLDEVYGTKYWRFAGHGLDSNSTYTLNKLIDAGQYTAGTGTYAVTRYSILAEKPNGTWEKITSTSSGYSTATTKTVNTSGFVLNQLRYYNTTTNRGTGTLITTNTIEKQSASVNYAYSFNCSTAPGWEIGDYIYLVGTLGVDGLFYLDTTQWWSTSLPTTEDGKLYIQLGLALTTTDATGSFFMERPIYYYKGGAVRLWSNVSGVNDGTNWTSLTIDGVTKNLPSGGGGSQVNSDWNATSGVAEILNKPALATVATSGSYNDLSNKPTIPTAVSQLTNDRFVRYDTSSQGLSSTQKYNARTNIGAGTSNFSGYYSDLVNAPIKIVEYDSMISGAEDSISVMAENHTQNFCTYICMYPDSYYGIVALHLSSATYNRSQATEELLEASVTFCGIAGTTLYILSGQVNVDPVEGESDDWSSITLLEIPEESNVLSWVNNAGYTKNNGTVTSVRVQAGTGLASSQSTAQSNTLNTTISVASGYKLPTTSEWNSKSSVSGTDDGTNWTSLTVDGVTKNIGLTILNYGTSTWQDFINAYNTNRIVYCKTSSGSGYRLAFMAYVNSTSNPTNVEFQYYRSVTTHSDSQQGDEVYVYKLASDGTWTTTSRNTFTKIDVGTGLSKAYSNGVLTLTNTGGSGVNNVVICTFTENNGTITCDKSIEEMISAYTSGKTCIGLMAHNNSGSANEYILAYIEGDVEDPTMVGSKVQFTAVTQWGIEMILGTKGQADDSWSTNYDSRTTYIDTVCYEEPNSNITITIGYCFDLNNNCFVKYSNNSWIADYDTPIYDGTILYAVADDAYYIYDSSYGIKQLSKGKSHIETDFDNQYYYLNCILPVADSFGEITLNDNNMGSSCYITIDGMFTVNADEFYNASVGKSHTICIYNSKSTDVDITVSDFYMTSVQGFISSGLDLNNTFTVNAGSHAELNIMFKDSDYSSTSYGNHALASIIVKSDFEDNINPIQ